MKLAIALQERADLNRKLEKLRSRLQNNAIVQDGETPSESPEALMKELDESVRRLAYLVARINQTNGATLIDGVSVTEWIARKDALRVQISLYNALIDAASQNTYRASRTEIKILPTVNVSELQRKIDGYAKELRELDNRLQASNWQTDLIE